MNWEGAPGFPNTPALLQHPPAGSKQLLELEAGDVGIVQCAELSSSR